MLAKINALEGKVPSSELAALLQICARDFSAGHRGYSGTKKRIAAARKLAA